METLTQKLTEKEAAHRLSVSQATLKNWHTQIHVPEDSLTPGIIEKMEDGQNFILKKNCLWFMGIVSGNNRESLLNYHVDKGKPVLLGKNIFPGSQPEPINWLKMDRSFQQSPNLNLYRKEKVVYRFISGKPVCAVDRKGYLCVNSANCFIPERQNDMEKICLVLNDSCLSFYFKNKFNSVKTLQSHLKNSPFPDLSLIEKPEELTAMEKKLIYKQRNKEEKPC